MTDQAEVRIFAKLPRGSAGYGLYYAEDVTTSDTVTLDDFDVLLNVMVIKVSDSSEITAAIDATTKNEIDISGTITSENVLIFAQGV